MVMDEILHHLRALNYCSSWGFRDLRWCKISSINSRDMKGYIGIYRNNGNEHGNYWTCSIYWGYMGILVPDLGFRVECLGLRLENVGSKGTGISSH